MNVSIAYFIIGGLYIILGLQHLHVDHKQNNQAEDNVKPHPNEKSTPANSDDSDRLINQ